MSDENPSVASLYLGSLWNTLREHRPELVAERRGRWEGPFLDARAPTGLWFKGPKKFKVCVSPWDVEEGLWLHVSVSSPRRPPHYDELTDIVRRFFRETDTVLHVWPPKAEHYKLHPHCLHLWTPMDGHRPIPDLRGTGGGV